MNIIITIIFGFFKLSSKLVPINPQKAIKDILPINVATKNFLKLILDKPAAIFIKNAGVNGIAIIRARCCNLLVSIFDIIISKFLMLFILFWKNFLNNLRHRKKEKKQPIHVSI